ncbi:MAG: hypothetical protein LC640_03440, partial [Frankia sp.]|nr:hypothetical protein [Frankia sp.]
PANLPILFGFTALTVVGCVLVMRLPRNVVGWLLAVSGLAAVGGLALEEYAAYALARNPTPGTAAAFATLVANASWYLALGAVLLLIIVFPTGRPTSRRWRPVLWCAVTSLTLLISSSALRPGQLDPETRYTNPLGVPALAGATRAAESIATALVLVATFGALLSIGFRFVRARGVERQQLKWFAATAVFAVVAVAASDVLGEHLGELVGNVTMGIGLTSLPIAIATAVLRYRLYDIDRIISRTVTYAVVTVLLVLPYVVVVPLVTRIVGGSSVAVAAATLAVAAAFNPLRRRVQGRVDRRFNRARYDAARTVEAFSSRLRDEVDLEQLTGDLLSVVTRTMQPAHASLWLREAM